MGWFDVVRPARTAAALAVALLVAACGGGGGGKDKDPDVNAAPQSSSVSLAGVASKGLLKQAVVKVFAVTPAGLQGDLIATTRTDDTGHYVLPRLTPGAMVYIEVSADDKTLMADEATVSNLKPSATFKLRAVTVLSSTGQTTLQVTPFSDMAVAIAIKNGGFKPDVVEAANAQIVSFANYDVLRTEPTFDASNKPTNPVALNLAAISALAKNNVFDDCKVPSTAAAKVECVIANLNTQSVVSTDLVAKLEAAKDGLKKAGYRGSAALPLDVQPPLVVDEFKSGVDEAKALIKSVRSNAETSVTNALTQRWDAVAKQFQNAVAPVNRQSQQLLLLAAQATAVLDNPARVLGTTFTASYNSWDAVCNLYKDDAAQTAASSYAELKTITCVGDTGYVGENSATVSSTGVSSSTQQIFTQAFKISKTATVHRYAIRSALYFEEVTHHSNGPDTSGGVAQLSAYYDAVATLTPASNGPSYSAMTLKGNLPPSLHAFFKPEDATVMDLSAAVSAVGDLTQLNVTGLVQTVVNAKPGAQSIINDGSYLQVRTLVAGDVGSALKEDQAGAIAHLLVSSALPSGASMTGVLEIDLATASVSKKNGYGSLSFSGKVYQSAKDLLFDGSITLATPTDAVSNNGSITLNGTLPIPSRPDMVLHLTTDTKSTGLHSFVGSYAQGSTKVLINGAFNEDTGLLTNLTLSTPSGVTATVHSNDEDFNITKGSDILGVFTKSNGRILYADHTYEQY